VADIYRHHLNKPWSKKQMKLNLSIPAILFMGMLGTNSLAAVDSELMAAYEEECKSYAKEDNVPEDEMEAYINQCVEDLTRSQMGEGQTESSGTN
jgi:poly-gamma-glutamate capsule biosynthesis protein CapA/YwtB (metallophosphatase superfamily)